MSSNILVNTCGGLAKRFAPCKFDRTYVIFNIGLASGLLGTLYTNTSRPLEFRPTINVFSKGQFAESLFLGTGYVFNTKQGLMTAMNDN